MLGKIEGRRGRQRMRRLDGITDLTDMSLAAGALDLRRGHQEPALVASGKAGPHTSCLGASGIPLPSMPGPKTLCGVGAGTLGFLSSADMNLGGQM